MMTERDAQPAKDSGTFRIGGDVVVDRLGFGAMRVTGPGVWGDPEDPAEAVRVLRRAYELGVTFIDTADSYGPFVSEQLIKKALHPYADDLVIATKAGLTRSGPDVWRPVGRPEYLRQQCELSLRHLGLDCIPLYQLHRIDSKVPLADQLGELVKLKEEGKIRHIGLSNTNKRLVLAYGQEYGLRVLSKSGWGTMIEMVMPADRQTPAGEPAQEEFFPGQSGAANMR